MDNLSITKWMIAIYCKKPRKMQNGKAPYLFLFSQCPRRQVLEKINSDDLLKILNVIKYSRMDQVKFEEDSL